MCTAQVEDFGKDVDQVVSYTYRVLSVVLFLT